MDWWLYRISIYDKAFLMGHFMKFVIFSFVFFMQTAIASDHPWEAYPYTLGSLSGAPDKNDAFVRILVSPKGGEMYYGPVIVWKKKASDDFIQITNSLGSFSRAINEIVAGMKEPDRRIAIKNAIGNYCRSPKSAILTGEERKQTIAKIAKTDSNKAKAIETATSDIQEQWTQDKWRVTFFIITGDNDIEKHNFNGRANPFSIIKHEVEVVVLPNEQSQTTQ